MSSDDSATGRRGLWIAAAAGFGGFVILQITLAASRASTLGDAAVPMTVVIIGGLLIAITVAIAFSVRPQRRRLHALRNLFPDSLVLPVLHPQELVDSLRWLGLKRRRLGDYGVIVVDEAGISLWKGSEAPVRVFELDAARVMQVDLGVATVNRPITVIALTVHDAEGQPVWIPFAPTLEGWRLPFARLDHRALESICQEVKTRIVGELPR
ncbi:hypothetical protein [Microbacterium sp. Marseille-Q6648]|uniref:hypothetical protein n=1 Tax=Microbacterium sp. Marseille-Q6648 TaxID=2937991 RepID=UPI00203E4B7C|nr:hypothetical protein [Microbacterium sp. Marseille-Q6648]